VVIVGNFALARIIVYHFFIYNIIVIYSIINNIIIKNPSKEVQLAYGSFYILGFIIIDKKGYAMMSPK
jgi:hypothetical protein